MTIYSQLLNDILGHRLSPAQRQYMDFTRSGSRHMNDVIEGVLVFSRTMHEGFVAADVPAADALSASPNRARGSRSAPCRSSAPISPP